MTPTAIEDLAPDESLCPFCREPIPASATARIVRLPKDNGIPHHASAHIGCEYPGPVCPVHRVLMEGGGEYWTCCVKGCDERVLDHGDHPDAPL